MKEGGFGLDNGGGRGHEFKAPTITGALLYFLLYYLLGPFGILP